MKWGSDPTAQYTGGSQTPADLASGHRRALLIMPPVAWGVWVGRSPTRVRVSIFCK